MENDFIPDSSIKASTAFNIYHDKFYARPNTQRNSPRSWCANAIDEKPFWQVDLGEIKSVCGVGTMGRGSHGSNYGYPISYSVQLSNDSFNWTFIEEGNAETVSRISLCHAMRPALQINHFLGKSHIYIGKFQVSSKKFYRSSFDKKIIVRNIRIVFSWRNFTI